MITYSKFRPTAYYIAGLGCADRQDWLVAPCTVDRDSGVHDTANWRAVTEILKETDPEGLDHEAHRFRHWGPGWYEIVLIRPGTKCVQEAQKIEDRLADYPIVSEAVFSEVESEFQEAAWESMGAYPFLHALSLGGFCLKVETQDWLKARWSRVWGCVASAYDSLNCPEYEDDGTPHCLRQWADRLSRDGLASLLRDCHKEAQRPQDETCR